MSVDAPLVAAAGGDQVAFQALVTPHLAALHLHSYRMLGSYHDAEDAVQETLLRAWQGLGGYEGRGPLRHWLYRITTTTCLKMIDRRRRDPATVLDVAWLQPYPDAMLDRVGDADADPAAVVEQRESVALAFITALQLLPATQRAVLILRDVLTFPAGQVADMLGMTTTAVHSCLRRARATITATAPAQARPPAEDERRIVAAFVQAWADCDIPALTAVLHEDITLTMPPEAIRISGRDAVVRFFTTVPADGHLDLITLVETRANGDPALAAYLPRTSQGLDCHGYGIMLLTVANDRITAVTGFPGAGMFREFGLPLSRLP
jgi:RNA polymerase sigma-70 factor (ECF subfamily)